MAVPITQPDAETRLRSDQALASLCPDRHIVGHHVALAGALGAVVVQRLGFADLAHRTPTQVQRDVVTGDRDRAGVRIMRRPFDAFGKPVRAGPGDDKTLGQVLCGNGVHAVRGAW